MLYRPQQAGEQYQAQTFADFLKIHFFFSSLAFTQLLFVDAKLTLNLTPPSFKPGLNVTATST